MHAREVLQKLLHPALSKLDRRNAGNLLSAVQACLAGRRLVQMELARHWPGALRVAAPLKRLDRLLGNARVQAVRRELYQAAALWLMRQAEPVLIVDWSGLKGDGRWYLLRAGVAVRGRTLTVYEEVHPQRRLGKAAVHGAFLQRLQALLAQQVCPVIVTDAGFQVPWFRAVEALRWHWLGRVRGRVKLCPQQETVWHAARQYFSMAQRVAQELGAFWLSKSNPIACHVVCVKRAAKGRVQRRRNGQRARSSHAEEMARRQREPWLLACSESLSERRPAELVRLYGLRMQIESSFRDLKSHRYGCAFEDTLTRSAERLQILLLIYLLSSLVAWAAGLSKATEQSRFRLSILRGGWEHLRQHELVLADPVQALRRLRQLIESLRSTP